MTMTSFLDFLITHNEGIIEWLIVAILLLIGGLVIHTMFFRKSEGDTVSSEALHETLKELAKKSSHTVAPVASSDVASVGEGEAAVAVDGESTVAEGAVTQRVADPEQLNKFKKELEAREQELAQLRSQLAEVQEKGVEGSDDQVETYLAQIRELEGKLAEYEIIEEDIADLSHYKAENERLKKEIEDLKKSGPVPGGTDETSASKNDDDIVSEFGSALSDGNDSSEGELPAAEPSGGGGGEDDLESLIAEAQREHEEEQKTAKEQRVQAEAESEADDNSTPEKPESQPEADDIFAEFASPSVNAANSEETVQDQIDALLATQGSNEERPQAPTEEASTPEAADPLAAIDTARMMEEMAELSQPEDDDTSALEKEMDVDKMAEEATKLAASDNNN